MFSQPRRSPWPTTVSTPSARAPDTPFNRADGYSGQDYRREDEAALGRRPVDQPAPDADIPPDNGRRAGVDPATGEVRGAGGGQPGEDLDGDAATGDGYPLTGGEGADKRPGDLGLAPSGS